MFRDHQVFQLGILDHPHCEEIPSDKKDILDEIVNQNLVLACRLHPTEDYRKPYEEQPADFFASYHPDFETIYLSPKMDVNDSLCLKYPGIQDFEDHIDQRTRFNFQYQGLNIEMSKERNSDLNK